MNHCDMEPILPTIPRSNRIVILGGDVTYDYARRREIKDKDKFKLFLLFLDAQIYLRGGDDYYIRRDDIKDRERFVSIVKKAVSHRYEKVVIS